MQQVDEFAPRLRWIVGILARFLPHVGVDDVAGRVARIRQAVQALLGFVVGLYKALGDVHHAWIEFVDDVIVGEIVENTRFGEHAEINVDIDGDDVGFTIFHQSRTQISGCVGRIVDVDFDVGMGFLKFLCFCGEPVRCFGFELEEIQSDGSSGAVAATCKAGRQRDCACGRKSAVYNPPEFTYTSGGIRFHSRLLCIFSLLRWSGFLTTPPLLRIIEGGSFHSQLSAPVRGGKQKRRDFVTLRK